MPKTVRVVVFFATLLLCNPFVKVPIQLQTPSGNAYSGYDRLSGLDIIIETTAGLFEGAFANGGMVMAIVVLIFGVVALVQFIASLMAKEKIVLYTAVFLFAMLFSVLVFIYKKDEAVIVRWAYYSYLAVQALLIFISGNKKQRITVAE